MVAQPLSTAELEELRQRIRAELEQEMRSSLLAQGVALDDGTLQQVHLPALLHIIG